MEGMVVLFLRRRVDGQKRLTARVSVLSLEESVDWLMRSVFGTKIERQIRLTKWRRGEEITQRTTSQVVMGW
jgi:hypothetical protein